MSAVRDVADIVDGGPDSRLLSIARWLVVLMPVFYLGRAPVDVALSLVALMFLARSALRRDWAWTRSLWFRIAMTLWVWMMFVSFFAVSPWLSFQQSIFWWRYLVFAAALEWWIMDETCMRRVLMVATVVVAAVSLDAWIQFFAGVDLLGHPRPDVTRLDGPFEDLRVGSWIMRLMFPVLLGAFAWRLWRRNTGAAVAAMVGLTTLLTGAVVLSGERMSTLLMLLGLVLGALLWRRQFPRILLAGVTALALGGVILLATHHNLIDRYFTQTEDTVEHIKASPYGQLWRSGLHIALQRPITGVGLKNFRVACDDPQLGLPPSVENRCSTHPHNLYLEWLLDSGVVGLGLFVLLVAAWAYRLAPAAWCGTASPWLYGPAIAVFLVLWPLGPSGSFFSNWYGGVLYLELGWALAAVRVADRAHTR